MNFKKNCLKNPLKNMNFPDFSKSHERVEDEEKNECL